MKRANWRWWLVVIIILCWDMMMFFDHRACIGLSTEFHSWPVWACRQTSLPLARLHFVLNRDFHDRQHRALGSPIVHVWNLQALGSRLLLDDWRIVVNMILGNLDLLSYELFQRFFEFRMCLIISWRGLDQEAFEFRVCVNFTVA